MSLDEWKSWFVSTSALVLSKIPLNGVAIFFQTDIKHEGEWVDKAYLIQKAAELERMRMLWHKITCRVAAGGVTYGRPAYSHFLCFGRDLRAEVSKSTADVLPTAGEVTWARGMGYDACVAACKFVLENTDTRTIVDPFCGHGTVLLAANELGMESIGIELGRKRAKKARGLQISDLTDGAGR